MAVEFIIAPEVEQDLAETYAWYKARRTGLGEEFLSCVDASIAVICCMPEMYAAIHEQYRRRFVRCFPYAIFYEYTAGRVTVYGVLHASRDQTNGVSGSHEFAVLTASPYAQNTATPEARPKPAC